MEEQLDILNEQGEKTGEVKGYTEVHAKGLLHRTIHVWLINSKGELLLQKRTKNKRIFPLHWDIAIGGHVSAGQSAIEGAQMEAREELGLHLAPADLQYLFTLRENNVIDEGVWSEKGFNEVYVVRSDLSATEFKLAPDEVEEVRWFSKEEFKKLIDGKGEPLARHFEEYEKLLEYLEKSL